MNSNIIATSKANTSRLCTILTRQANGLLLTGLPFLCEAVFSYIPPLPSSLPPDSADLKQVTIRNYRSFSVKVRVLESPRVPNPQILAVCKIQRQKIQHWGEITTKMFHKPHSGSSFLDEVIDHLERLN